MLLPEMLMPADTTKGAACEVTAAVPIGRISRVLGEGRYQTMRRSDGIDTTESKR
jgi:hypothetical protein